MRSEKENLVDIGWIWPSTKANRKSPTFCWKECIKGKNIRIIGNQNTYMHSNITDNFTKQKEVDGDKGNCNVSQLYNNFILIRISWLVILSLK